MSEFEAPYLLPHEIENLIISYTQRNNESISYFDKKAHMPKNAFICRNLFDRPPVGTIGYCPAGNCRPFVVVRNDEYPLSVLVVYPLVKFIEDTIIFCKDASSTELKDAFDPVNLDDYMYNVYENVSINMCYNIIDLSILKKVRQVTVELPHDKRMLIIEHIEKFKQSRSNLSNKQ